MTKQVAKSILTDSNKKEQKYLRMRLSFPCTLRLCISTATKLWPDMSRAHAGAHTITSRVIVSYTTKAVKRRLIVRCSNKL